MKNKDMNFNGEELELLEDLKYGQWEDKPLTASEISNYKNSAKYTKSLAEKKQTTIRFAVGDLAIVKAKAKDLGIGYQNLIQALVHNYATGKLKLEA